VTQVENEYGSYGSDRAYLRYLADGLIRRGIDVMLFTSGGPVPRATLVESMGRANYGPRLGERKGILGGVRLRPGTLLERSWFAATALPAVAPASRGLQRNRGARP
jgi:beta-galactosidase